jgi:hypothetical protein
MASSSSSSSSSNATRVIKESGPFSMPAKTPDPFLFLAYHRESYPAGDDNFGTGERGNGMDFDADKPYRYYHGDKVPGFPQVGGGNREAGWGGWGAYDCSVGRVLPHFRTHRPANFPLYPVAL